MKSDEERCIAAGMDGYLSKPVTADALARALARFALTPVVPAAEPPVDAAAALRGTDGDAELLAELCELFVEEWPARHAELESACGAGAARLERSAHGLKGVLAALGAGQCRRERGGLETPRGAAGSTRRPTICRGGRQSRGRSPLPLPGVVRSRPVRSGGVAVLYFARSL